MSDWIKLAKIRLDRIGVNAIAIRNKPGTYRTMDGSPRRVITYSRPSVQGGLAMDSEWQVAIPAGMDLQDERIRALAKSCADIIRDAGLGATDE